MIDIFHEYEEQISIEQPTNYQPTNDVYGRLIRDSQEELHPAYERFKELNFFIHLFHIKMLNGWTNESFNMLLGLLLEVFPLGVQLPKIVYKAKKFLAKLGSHYKKIDVPI